MAVLVIVNVKGVKKQDYENLRKEIKWEQNQPKGAILHMAGIGENGDMQVADMWETAEDFNNFAATRLGPATQKLKLPQPEAKIYPLHNANVFEQVEKYRMAGMTR